MIRQTNIQGTWFVMAAVLATAVSAASYAEAVKLYKWVDENGSTHYHQTPPPAGTQFVEEKEFDGELNVVPSDTNDAADSEGPADSRQPGAEGSPDAGSSGRSGRRDSVKRRTLTPEELTAIAEETAPKPEQPIELPGIGAEPAGGGETAPSAAGANASAAGAGAGTAPGAAPAVVPPPMPPPVAPVGP